MADAQKTIDLIFNGVDRTGAAVQSALANTQRFSGSVKDLTQPIADFTVGAVKLEAGLLAAGVAMTTFAVKTAGDFDAAFRQISTLFDASDEDLAKFKDNILSYAASSSKSLEDITNALSAAIGSGVDYTQSLGLLATAEKLAVATRADLTGTTEVLVGTLNAYGMSTDKAGQVADLFFKIIADGKIEMNDLSQYLANITPIAATAGVSLEEIGAAVATLTAAGVQPSTAIDSLRSAISNIIKPSEQATKLAAELGIEFDANALKSKGLAGVLGDVARATGGSADKMAILFGDVTGLSSVMTLTGAQAGTFAKALQSMGNATGSVAEAFAKMKGDIDEATQKAANAFQVMLIEIGKPLLDEFGGIAEAVAGIFQALGASVKSGALSDLVKYVEGLFGGLQGALEQVAKNLPAALAKADFSGFKGGIEAVRSAFADLFDNIDITTVDGLRAAIETAGAAFVGLSKYVAGVITSFEPLFDALVEIGKGAKEMDSSIFELAGTLGGIITQINLALPLLTGLLAILTTKQALSFAPALAGLLPHLQTLVTLLAGAGSLTVAAGAAGYATGTVLSAGIDKVLSAVTGSRTSLGSWIYDLVHGGDEAEKMGNKVADAAGKIDGANGAIKGVADATKGAAGALGDAGDAIKGAGDAAKGAANPFEAANNLLLENAKYAEMAAGSSGKLSDATKKVSQYVFETRAIIDEATGKITGYEQVLVEAATASGKLDAATGKAAGSLGKLSEDTKKAEEAQRKWNEELQKMQHAEKLKLIEQQTAVMTAQIEASAKKITAAYESINVGITSTGDVLGELFGLFENYSSLDWSAIRVIEDQINKENELRREQFTLQKELTQAQIAQMKAQTQAMLKGDGIIKIDGAGLKPHLEAFMWEILRAVQVRVNQDGLKMLLGA